MPNDRPDMSTWITHFVHRRNPENNPDELYGEGEAIHFPYTSDFEQNERFSAWYTSDAGYPIEPDAYAIQVVWKIIDDGHIRSTWSFRDGKPTVYGPRSAVCFTEMPLYALIQYARKRADQYNVEVYGISVLKTEAFRAGARPVIYGLTGNHVEVPRVQGGIDNPANVWPRLLAPECGLSETEQYRYVSFSIGGERYSDWTHEREWRWCDSQDRYSCPGLPLYLNEAPTFSQILIFCPTSKDAIRVLDRLKAQYDKGYDDFGDSLHLANLRNTRVIALDAVPQNAILHLEDIPTRHLASMSLPIPSDALVKKVSEVLTMASEAAQSAADAAYAAAKKDPKDGCIRDVAGFSSLMIAEPQSELTAALLRLKAIEPSSGASYMFTTIKYTYNDQALCVHEAAIGAAEAVFEREFPECSVWVRSWWD